MLYENAFGAAGALLRKCLFELVFANGTHPFLFLFYSLFFVSEAAFCKGFYLDGQRR